MYEKLSLAAQRRVNQQIAITKVQQGHLLCDICLNRKGECYPISCMPVDCYIPNYTPSKHSPEMQEEIQKYIDDHGLNLLKNMINVIGGAITRK